MLSELTIIRLRLKLILHSAEVSLTNNETIKPTECAQIERSPLFRYLFLLILSQTCEVNHKFIVYLLHLILISEQMSCILLRYFSHWGGEKVSISFLHLAPLSCLAALLKNKNNQHVYLIHYFF